MIHALLVTHGKLGHVLIDIIKSLLGEQSGIRTVSNTGLSAAEITRILETEVSRLEPQDELVLFSDLEGGSCETACRAVTARSGRCHAISGLNLPMLLEFCHYRHRLASEPLLERVVRKGRSGIQLTGSRGANPCP